MGKGHSMPCTTSATNDKPKFVVVKQLPESPATKDATALLGMGGVMNTMDDTFYEPGEREGGGRPHESDGGAASSTLDPCRSGVIYRLCHGTRAGSKCRCRSGHGSDSVSTAPTPADIPGIMALRGAVHQHIGMRGAERALRGAPRAALLERVVSEDRRHHQHADRQQPDLQVAHGPGGDRPAAFRRRAPPGCAAPRRCPRPRRAIRLIRAW